MGRSAYRRDPGEGLVYVTNGHKSRESVWDYDWRFWCHDIYAGGSSHSRVKDFFFRLSQHRYFGRGDSHAGYQKNRLFLQRNHENGFLEASYLMGTALEEDCRSLVSADLDNDGRKDLAVMTYQSGTTKEKALHLFRNVGASSNHWIGFDLTRKAGSRKAKNVLLKILEDYPNDLDVRWLLNIASMTLGEYPHGIPEQWRVPPETFESDYQIERFVDVAGRHGLDVNALAGGVVVEDFNRDGTIRYHGVLDGLEGSIEAVSRYQGVNRGCTLINADGRGKSNVERWMAGERGFEPFPPEANA